ncbi:translocation and assembly module lipoprotein TamL [Parapedobacter koreensis]|uniref:Surface antigen n=1 Tax=Parapedobacter koreensis TaxID=332977 RepID=A0A1H7NU75_9SPHI|nr:BamA/TamA family outer membrane protein [Parapedobacter koreensis]SEL26991.1 Surface antigen [Parapedobacter koreensis]
MDKRYRLFVYASILLLLLFTASCRSTRLLEDGQALVTKAEIEGVDPRLEEQAKAYIPPDIRPNSRIDLFIYNLANGKKGRYRTEKIRNVGEPPHLLDSPMVDFSTQQINRFLASKGYFNATVTNEIVSKGKRAHVYFYAKPGVPYTLRRVDVDIADPQLARIYADRGPDYWKIASAMRYDADSLVAERERLYHLMRQQGYYEYLRQYMRVDVDTSLRSNQADLKIIVDNPEGQAAHTKFTIDSSFVVIRHNRAELNRTTPEETVLNDQVYFEDYTGRFRPVPIARYLFHRQGDSYNVDMENLTYDRLYELNGFHSVKITYSKPDSNKLNAYYELTPRPYMANQIEGEYTFNSGMNGFNIGNTFTHRNLFGGLEQLEVKLRYGVLFDSRLPGNLFDRVFNNDFQVGVNITVPRLITPFALPLGGRSGLPRTVFSANLQAFDQFQTYSNRYFSGTLSYNWSDTRYKQHNLTPLVLEYRYGQLNEDFAQRLIDQGFLLYVRSNNRAYFGLGSQYVYTLNAVRLSRLEDFVYFRGALDLSGNLLGLASQVIDFRQNVDGEKEVLGVPYLQYAKVETDLRYYRYLGGDRQLIVRLNPGVAVPYGNNSSLLIFEKSLFGGGMNGIRAWQARTLGPGNYNRRVLDPDLRLNLRNLDQLGEVKLEGNVEYRFRVLNDVFGAKLKAATFADFGNVWRIRENELNPEGEFKFDKFLGQLAIGTGVGLRFDRGYFVIRLDAGIKVRDPQFEGASQWVITEFFNSKEFKEQYRITNAPDRYNFVQYNFGIGMPF